MKGWLRRSRIAVFCAILIMFIPQVYAVVVWSGAATANVTASSDPNLTLDGILGDIILPASPATRTIFADTGNVNVTLVNGPINIVGNAGGPSRLYLIANAGNTIFFNIDLTNLTFKGSNNVAKDPLLIVVSGAGSVVFNITGAQTVSFTADAATGGTQLYELMATPGVGGGPVLSFLRNPNPIPNAFNSTINIGPRSVMSYIAPTAVSSGAATEQGIIQFDPRNSGAGRHILNIQDTGAFVIDGSFVTITGGVVQNITLADINRTIPAGLNAIARIVANTAPQAISASLLVTNSNNTLSNLLINPFNQTPNPFNGILYGFILGANGTLDVQANSYLDYVDLSLNQCPAVGEITGCEDIAPSKIVKKRNPGALIVDGNPNQFAVPAQINLAGCSAIVFRSGVDNLGVVENGIASAEPFTIDPALRTPDEGNTVFDVEGLLNVNGPAGSSGLNTKLEILSWFVTPIGGRVLIENAICPLVFPLRTFAKFDMCIESQYNSANFLINNTMNLFDTSINHTDQNHRVFPDNDIRSEPAYIGGESFTINDLLPRPRIDFNNSRFYIHTDVALTGVDLVVPNTHDPVNNNCVDNISRFIFYQNGKTCDKGTGRYMILGTQPGSTACNGCTVISRDAHLDVQQLDDCPNATAAVRQKLLLNTAPNDNTIIDPDLTCGCVISPNAANEFSIQTIFLGNASNISVGTQHATFNNPTTPELQIAGNFFSFETRGGPKGIPAASNVTGVGGIFVDDNGVFCICPQYRASVATMVTKSGNGIINLPKNQVYFDDQIGIAQWQLNLNTQQVIIGPNECLSDYTLNWLSTTKNYAVFMPYELGSVNICSCPPVTTMNVSGIPIVQGQVNQLQIQGSRIGDPAVVKIDGGWVREIIFEELNYSAEAPNGVFVIQNEGRLGLGNAHRNIDSLEANIVLGVNGVTLIANGNSQVEINEDIIINNICSLLRGPDFAAGNQLRFTAETPKAIRITKTGTLDLRQFAGETVVFGGELVLVLEPGARIILGGNSNLQLVDNAQLLAEAYTPYPQAGNPNNNVTNTDAFRAKLIGVGSIVLSNNASFVIPKNAFVGVETLSEILGADACSQLDTCGTTTILCEIPTTEVIISLLDSGQFIVGDRDDAPAGAFQVGNTITHVGHSVSFTFVADGKDARAGIKTQGFMGIGVGIVDKHDTAGLGIPNNWLVGSLFNVGAITFIMNDGQFAHDRIYSGDNELASLFAIANSVAGYSLIFAEPTPDVPTERTDDVTFTGGGNMIRLVTPTASFNPVVTNIDGFPFVGAPYEVGMFASSPLQASVNLVLASASVFFNAIRTFDATTVGGVTTIDNQLTNYAKGFVSFRGNRVQDRAGYVAGGLYGRQDISDIIDITGGTPGDVRQRAADIGAAFIALNFAFSAPQPIGTMSQIQ